MTRVMVVSVLFNCCCGCVLLVARHVMLNVVKCDAKLLKTLGEYLLLFFLWLLIRTCSVSYGEKKHLFLKKTN